MASAPPRTGALDRLLWRAGVGASPLDRAAFAGRDLQAAVEALLKPRGPAYGGSPALVAGQPLQPLDVWGDDVLWFLDRLVRTRQPLVERMTLNLHDHFATSNAKVSDSGLMLRQIALLRSHALGNFGRLLHALVRDPAMQIWLDIRGSSKADPNENFARELMELFTLGLGHYGERDVREAARAFTGFWYDRDRDVIGVDPTKRDTGVKRVFGHRGRFGPQDIIRLCLHHPAHPRFLCAKLFGYLAASHPPESLLHELARVYVKSGFELAPVLRGILRSDAFYAGLDEPDLVKPPLVYVAAMHRTLDLPVTSRDWTYLFQAMGQLPLYPPNVGGWPRGADWLGTGSLRARFIATTVVLRARAFDDKVVPAGEAPEAALAWAEEQAGWPFLSPASRARLLDYARAALPRGAWDHHALAERRRVLLHLLLSGADAQLH